VAILIKTKYKITKFLFSAQTPKKGTKKILYGNLRQHKVAQNPPHNPLRTPMILGKASKKNRFKLDEKLVPKYKARKDMDTFELLPYVSKRSAKNEK